MRAASLLLVLLSNHGYWFGGQENTITIRPAAEGGLPAAVISWKLMLDGAELQHGRTDLRAGGADTVIRLTAPATRVRITMRWLYQVVGENGDIPIFAFPSNIGDGVATRLRGKQIVVWDRPQRLPDMLERLHAPHTIVTSGEQLAVMRPDILLVGPDAIGKSPFAQSPLLSLAESGASVMIFRQTVPPRLMGYDLVSRNRPAKMPWRNEHPLLLDLEPQDLQSWTDDAASVLAVQLPADEPALEIGYYPREVPGARPAPIDAILLSKTVGKGRFVLCQIPLGDWNSDPRSRILLFNALDYLSTRPQPTPPPSRRLAPPSAAPASVRTIDVPQGE
jgi:hypothetical protein